MRRSSYEPALNMVSFAQVPGHQGLRWSRRRPGDKQRRASPLLVLRSCARSLARLTLARSCLPAGQARRPVQDWRARRDGRSHALPVRLSFPLSPGSPSAQGGANGDTAACLGLFGGNDVKSDFLTCARAELTLGLPTCSTRDHICYFVEDKKKDQRAVFTGCAPSPPPRPTSSRASH